MEIVFKDEIFNNKKIVKINALDYKNTDLNKLMKISVLRQRESEYACLLTHLHTIHTFSKTNYKNALIFEDDISLDYKKYWTQSIYEIIKNAPKDWEIIRLHYSDGSNYNKLYSKWDPSNIKIGYSNNQLVNTQHEWSAAAYIINNKAAKKIIKQIYHSNKFVLDDCIPLHVADYLIFILLITYTYKYQMFCIRKNNISYNTIKKPKRLYKDLKQLQTKRKNMLKHNKTKKQIKV